MCIQYSVETSFLELKQKQVINICDGKQLGKVCDVAFTYPEGRVLGIVVPGGKGFRFGKADLFIDLKNVTKIGIDVVFVDIKSAPKREKKRGKWEETSGESHHDAPRYPSGNGNRRDYGEYE